MECGICEESFTIELGTRYVRHFFNYDWDLCLLCRKISHEDQKTLLLGSYYNFQDKLNKGLSFKNRLSPEERWVPDLVKKSREAKEMGIWNEFRGSLIYKNLTDDKHKI